MQRVHFFKAHTRLGIINTPWGGSELNLGVEKGPDGILTKNYLSYFSINPAVTTYKFPNPQKIKKLRYKKTLSESLRDFTDIILSNSKPNETQVVIGGDHSISFASTAAILKKHEPAKIGYIQFDSHADLCTFTHSPSKNFHGMVTRALLDKRFDVKCISSLLKKRLLPANILYIGNLEVDEKERKFLTSHKIKVFDRHDIQKNPNLVKKKLERFMKLFEHLHISFDIDVFDGSLVKATGTPSKSGLLTRDVYPLLTILAKHKNISIDLVEVNPKKEGSKNTIKLARDVLTRLLPTMFV